MTTEQAVTLVKKKHTGTITPDEQARLEEWINQSSEADYHRFYHAFYEFLLSSPDTGKKPYDPGADPVVQKLEQYIGRETPVISLYGRYKTSWHAAAVILLVLAGGYLWMDSRSGSGEMIPAAIPFETAENYQNSFARDDNAIVSQLSDSAHPHNTEVYTRATKFSRVDKTRGTQDLEGNTFWVAPAVTLSVPAHSHYVVDMRDGSRVWLNAGSTLTMADGFGISNRDIWLSGEAYFEVNGNARHPFHVKSSRSAVQVLGTSFNMNCYADEPADKITLLRGAVNVKEGTTTIRLKENEQAVVSAGPPVKSTVNAEDAISWKKGYIEFKQANLTDIFRTVERWYGIKINYAGLRPMHTYTCRLSKNMTLKVLELLLSGAKLRVETKGSIMTVYPVN